MKFFHNATRISYCFLPWTVLLIAFGIGEANNNYDVLMLGNSYTHGNGGINRQLQFLLNSADGTSGQVQALTGGGMKLSRHAMGWDGSVLDTEQFDFVILQDQSQVPSFPFTSGDFVASRDGAIVLDERVEAAGAETIFFLTWGYRLGDQMNLWRSPNYLSMQANLERGYQEYAASITEEDGSRVPYIAPVGLAYKKIYNDIILDGGDPTEQGTLFASLYTGDDSHPTRSATYLAACVMFSTITGLSTIQMADDNLGLDDNTRLQLQLASDYVVFEDESLDYFYPWESTNDGPTLLTSLPTVSPSARPSESPSAMPSESPSSPPSESPSASPSGPQATELPTASPSMVFTEAPSAANSGSPTAVLTGSPTSVNTESPTAVNTGSPSTVVSETPSVTSSGSPSPTSSDSPIQSPSGAPSIFMESTPSEVPVASVLDSGATTTRATWLWSILAGIPLLMTLLLS